MVEIGEYGDPQGTPVVLHPGTPGTAGAGPLVAEAAVRHGVRLVVVSRPGYGESTSAPPGLGLVAEQVGSLADVLGLARLGVWGLSGGGPFALAQAAVTPERVTRVVVSAGPAPGGQVQTESELMEEFHELVDHFGSLDEDSFLAQAPPHERFLRDHPDLVPVFLANIRHALQTPDGYVRDNLSWGAAWDIDLAGISVPVDLVYGGADLMVRPENGRLLADLLPHATHTVIPDAGHGYATFGSADLATSLLAAAE